MRGAEVVDYNAWSRGYMPPSEHILIDQLAHRGARVVSGLDLAEGGAIWIVMRGLKITPAVRKAIRDMLDLAFDAQDNSPDTERK